MYLAAPRGCSRHRKNSETRHFLGLRPGAHTTDPARGMHAFRKGRGCCSCPHVTLKISSEKISRSNACLSNDSNHDLLPSFYL